MEIKVPPLGESITEALLSRWLVTEGEYVYLDDPLVEFETDKITIEINASSAGVLEKILVPAGKKIQIGTVIGEINTDGRESLPETTKNDLEIIDEPPLPSTEERIKFSPLRQVIANRLKESQNTAALVTTFDEIDMSAVMHLRTLYQEDFREKYGLKMGLMPFFVKATVAALKKFPELNAEVQGDEIVYKKYYNIGIAVGAPQGLVVPVLKNADQLNFFQIEEKISEFVKKAHEKKLSLEDLRGGTFTISNAGVYGSMISIPLVQLPQSGILGLNKIEKRAVVVDDQIVIRPIMYVALTYDHRLIDGKEGITFVNIIKNFIEDLNLLRSDVFQMEV